MPSKRQRDLGRRDPVSVIADLDEPPAAVLDAQLHRPRAGVERVLEQLLDHRGRPLDDLSSGDGGSDVFGQDANGHVGSPWNGHYSAARPSG